MIDRRGAADRLWCAGFSQRSGQVGVVREGGKRKESPLLQGDRYAQRRRWWNQRAAGTHRTRARNAAVVGMARLRMIGIGRRHHVRGWGQKLGGVVAVAPVALHNVVPATGASQGGRKQHAQQERQEHSCASPNSWPVDEFLHLLFTIVRPRPVATRTRKTLPRRRGFSLNTSNI
jgi:hypothetical protein